MATKYIYLDYGGKIDYFNELRYSLLSLKEQQGTKPLDVIIYTDDPQKYENISQSTISISEKIEEYSRGGAYYHRLKPCVLLHALELLKSEDDLIFLDTDTIIKKSLNDKNIIIDA